MNSLHQASIMASPHTGAFRPTHYEIAMAGLGMSSYLINSQHKNSDLATIHPDNTLGWAERLFYHCDGLGAMKTTPFINDAEKGTRKYDVGLLI